MYVDRRLFHWLKGTRHNLIFAVLSGMLAGLAVIGQAGSMAKIINGSFLEGQNLSQLTHLLLFFVLFSIGRAGLGWYSRAAGSKTARFIKNKLRPLLSRHLSEAGPLQLQGGQSGELSNTILQGVEALDAYFSHYLPQLFLSAIIPITILLFVFPIDLLSGFVLLFTAPLIPVFMILIGQTAASLTNRQWKSLSRMSAYFLDIIQGLISLKYMGRSKEEAKRIARVSEQFRQTTMGVLRIAFLSALVLELAATISTAVIAVEIGLRLMYARIPFEQALFILILAPEFYQPLRQLGARFHAGMEGVSAANRIFELLKFPTKMIPKSAKRDEIVFRQARFEHVTFQYPGKTQPAIRDISFELVPDSRLAIVGASGAGKSTIINLLLQFGYPQKGRIIVNGEDLSQLSRPDWLRHIAWVPQQPHLFNASVYENISMARRTARFDEIEYAARQAMFDEVVTNLPHGYETIIGEKGSRLSGGQAQRLALARAFLKKAPLLLLDEPTSNLDAVTEEKITQVIKNLSSGCSTLIVAHRLTTILNADYVLLMSEGRITEHGRPADLIRNNDAFARLVRLYRGEEAR